VACELSVKESSCGVSRSSCGQKSQSPSVFGTPPEGGFGVALWVRSDGVGTAADRAWNVVVRDAAVPVLGLDPQLWDLRVIPRAAILAARESGTPLTR